MIGYIGSDDSKRIDKLRKIRRKKVSQPHFGLSVRVKPTLPKVGSWSPTGLPKIQSSIAGVKSPCI